MQLKFNLIRGVALGGSGLIRGGTTVQVKIIGVRVSVIVFNATFNNISVISWLSGLLVEETGVHEENNRSVVSH